MIHLLTMEYLREEFLQLSKKDQELGISVLACTVISSLIWGEIALCNLMKKSSIEESKNLALKRLQNRCLDKPLAWKLRKASRMVERTEPVLYTSSLHSAWWKQK